MQIVPAKCFFSKIANLRYLTLNFGECSAGSTTNIGPTLNTENAKLKCNAEV